MRKEHVAVPVEVVEGEIPTSLCGAFLRNGPNPLFKQQKKRYHWFDGRKFLCVLVIYLLLRLCIELPKPHPSYAMHINIICSTDAMLVCIHIAYVLLAALTVCFCLIYDFGTVF